jgi:cardiolipin synthase
MGRFKLRARATFCLLLCCSGLGFPSGAATTKQQSLNEWRSLTATNAPTPRVFVKGEEARFYFFGTDGLEEFSGRWRRLRVPTDGYKVNSALLRWSQRLSRIPEGQHSWREATVIAGAEWRQLATNLLSQLTPPTPGHGAYYQAFLADRFLYRDADGRPRSSLLGEQPKDAIVEHQFSVDETLDRLSHLVDEHLARTHPRESLFLLMAPNAKRFTQPLLLDRQARECVLFSPAALYDTTERAFPFSATAEGLWALLPESHGLALLKNPVSSAARLVDMAIQTVMNLLRLPLPKTGKAIPPDPPPDSGHKPDSNLAGDPSEPASLPLAACPNGMDLAAWETWLDRYTGTRRELGSIRLLDDGYQFFTRFDQALADATNHIFLHVYIFDRDDEAVKIANLLKQRSSEIDVRVIFDRLSSIAAGLSPPATPMPEDFVPPSSILSYLKEDSRVHVRPFLNPWFSSDHSKVLLVDGQFAWLGGMNFGREYREEWHDLMFEIQGPIVRSFEKEFHHDWAHAGWLGDLAYATSLFSDPAPSAPASDWQPQRPSMSHPLRSPLEQGAQSRRLPGSDPSDRVEQTELSDVPGSSRWVPLRRLPTKTGWKPFSAAVLGALHRAQSYIYAENPYLFDKLVVSALVKARNRGVDVRVVLPRINDFKAGGRKNLVVANYLLERGVHVYFYPGMTHVKALLVDGWACVGSGNLNHLSLRINQEQNLATSDPAFVAQLKNAVFETDFNRSYELTQPISVDWEDFMADLVLEGF